MRKPDSSPALVLTRCPVCSSDLAIRRLECDACGTEIQGDFHMGWVRQLTHEQLGFLKVFVEARGKIKDVESALGLSYPTVVARLEDLARAVSGDGPPAPPVSPPRVPSRGRDVSGDRLEILEELAQGRIDAAEAARRLRKR